MREVVFGEFLMLIMTAWVWVGAVIRRDKSKTARILFFIVTILFLWIADDLCTYLATGTACPIIVFRIISYLDYIMGGVFVYCYCCYCMAMIEEYTSFATKVYWYGVIVFAINLIVTTVAFWNGSIIDLNTGEEINGMPTIVIVTQTITIFLVPLIIVKYDKLFGVASAVILSIFGVIPTLAAYVTSQTEIEDFSVVATALFALAVVEIAQNANTFKHNIEQKKALESVNQQLIVAKESAEKANMAKGSFLANMSHEIRTPINAVLGMDTMILRKSKDAEIRKYANDIQSAGKNLLAIINDILDFSKIESGKMELVPAEYDFSSLVNDVYNMISVKAKDKDLEFQVDIDESIPYRLYGDDVRIRQILVNLLTNAVKYTAAGKVSLVVSINEKIESKGEDVVSLRFAVKDTGIGIKPEDISKLTEEFVRIEESRNRNIEGTGLGINIVISLLSLMNSKLEVESVYGEGSTFYFDLIQPVTNNEVVGDITKRLNSSLLEEEEYLASFCIPEARLLVVDDNPMNLSVFSSLLSDMLCQIDEADSGAKCLELVKDNKYDIIFMDHMMPEMDGVETFHQMQKFGDYINASTPVVILTANAISGAKEFYLKEGFTSYLSKPIDVDKLETMIGKLIPDDKKKPAERIEQTKEWNFDTELPVIDGVDWKHAILKLKTESMVLDSVKYFSQMAEGELKALTGMYIKLTNSGEQADFDEYRIKVHSMKSNAATIGADHVAGLAKYLEYAAKDYNLDTINRLMPVFGLEWNKLKTAIDEAFGYNREQVEVENPIEKSELELLLDFLSEAMEESDLDRADAIVEELSNHSYPKEQMILLEKIRADVLNIDVEQLDNDLREWRMLL